MNHENWSDIERVFEINVHTSFFKQIKKTKTKPTKTKKTKQKLTLFCTKKQIFKERVESLKNIKKNLLELKSHAYLNFFYLDCRKLNSSFIEIVESIQANLTIVLLNENRKIVRRYVFVQTSKVKFRYWQALCSLQKVYVYFLNPSLLYLHHSICNQFENVTEKVSHVPATTSDLVGSIEFVNMSQMNLSKMMDEVYLAGTLSGPSI